MSDSTLLEVALREPGSTNTAKRLRRDGLIPAVVYGTGADPRPIAVSPRKVIEILRSDHGQNSILRLTVDGGAEQTALIHDYQVDPVSHRILHADFKRIDMNVEVEVDIPIEAVGEPRGVRLDHGIMDMVVRELRVRCLPGAIPDQIEVDVRELEIGDALHVSDLQIPEDVEVLTEMDATVVLVAAPAIEEEPDEEEDGLIDDAAEPEVIGKGGDDEDDEDNDE